MIPDKLQPGNEVRVVTPARSLAMPWMTDEVKKLANQRFNDLGLEVSFGNNVYEMDEFSSSSVTSRVDDLHAAFSDKNIKMVITVIGGFNSNQLLNLLDFDLIKNNPKIFCGYSDITALSNAIYARTGLLTYYGPHYFSFGDTYGFDYSLDYFKKCLFSAKKFEVKPSLQWSDDRWAADQENRNFINNEGYWIINKGSADGIIVGGNLCTFQLLQGTSYWPSLKNSILFLEDDDWPGAFTDVEFDRNLQSLIHQQDFDLVRGIIIGRFQKKSQINFKKLTRIINTKPELQEIPIIANVDFGHTSPQITYPIGGRVRLDVRQDQIEFEIFNH